MTDVLYVVKGDSEELRYSLRSLARHGMNVGRVVVAGTDLPRWLSDNVVRVDVPSPFDRKQKNIMLAVLEAMRRRVMDRPFLYSSDDHYLFDAADLDAFPWFVRPYGYPKDGANAYRWSVVEAGRLLAANGLPSSRRLDGHWNTHVDPADLAAVERMVAGYERSKYGVEPTTLFVGLGLARGAGSPVERQDCKLKDDSADFAAVARDLGTFSAIKLERMPRFRAWLGEQFPEPCRWEKT